MGEWEKVWGERDGNLSFFFLHYTLLSTYTNNPNSILLYSTLFDPIHAHSHTSVFTMTTTKAPISAGDAKILDMVFNPEGTMLPDKETETMLRSEPTGKGNFLDDLLTHICSDHPA